MQKPEFDQYAENYDNLLNSALPKGTNEDGYFAEYKIKIISNLLKNKKPRNILDFGCGAGRSLGYLSKHFPDGEIWGFDVSPASLNLAKSKLPTGHFFWDWQETENRKFDLILAANVFHHIPIDQHLDNIKTCYDHLTNDGSLFIFEHNPLNPVTRRVFERCPFDIDAEMIVPKRIIELAEKAGFKAINRAYTLFFPRQLAMLRGLEPLLSRVPLGAQYYVRMEK